MEGLQQNIQRLKEYKSRLTIFPSRKGKKWSELSEEERAKLDEEKANAIQMMGPIMPVSNKCKIFFSFELENVIWFLGIVEGF